MDYLPSVVPPLKLLTDTHTSLARMAGLVSDIETIHSPVGFFEGSNAWTLTMFQNDALDMFVEKPNPENPDQVWSDGQWTDLEIEREIIKVKKRKRYRFKNQNFQARTHYQ